MSAWFQVAIPLLRKLLSDPKHLDSFTRLMEPVVRKQFEEWVECGTAIPLFESISDLTITTMLHMFLGSYFATKHGKELVPLIRAYEKALQRPEIKLLPRWASKPGRLLLAVERRFETLVTTEMKRRLRNFDKYRDHEDYFQEILNAVGDTYSKGLAEVFCALTHRISNSHLGYDRSGASESHEHICVGPATCEEVFPLPHPSKWTKLERLAQSYTPRNRTIIYKLDYISTNYLTTKNPRKISSFGNVLGLFARRHRPRFTPIFRSR